MAFFYAKLLLLYYHQINKHASLQIIFEFKVKDFVLLVKALTNA